MFTSKYSITVLFTVVFCSLPVVATPNPQNTAQFVNVTAESDPAQSEFIRRAILTTAIENREPVDDLKEQTVPESTNKIFFFTEVINKNGENITHRWFRNGRLEAEVVLKIGSSRWRTYSSKNLVEGLRGNWQVEVVDQSNRLLATQTFTY